MADVQIKLSITAWWNSKTGQPQQKLAANGLQPVKSAIGLIVAQHAKSAIIADSSADKSSTKSAPKSTQSRPLDSLQKSNAKSERSGGREVLRQKN